MKEATTMALINKCLRENLESRRPAFHDLILVMGNMCRNKMDVEVPLSHPLKYCYPLKPTLLFFFNSLKPTLFRMDREDYVPT